MANNTVETILAMDREARRMETAAEEKRQAVAETVARHREDLNTAYEQGMETTIRGMQEEQKKRLYAEKVAIDTHQMECIAAMAAKVEQQHSQWVKALVDAVIGE